MKCRSIIAALFAVVLCAVAQPSAIQSITSSTLTITHPNGPAVDIEGSGSGGTNSATNVLTSFIINGDSISLSNAVYYPLIIPTNWSQAIQPIFWNYGWPGATFSNGLGAFPNAGGTNVIQSTISGQQAYDTFNFGGNDISLYSNGSLTIFTNCVQYVTNMLAVGQIPVPCTIPDRTTYTNANLEAMRTNYNWLVTNSANANQFHYVPVDLAGAMLAQYGAGYQTNTAVLKDGIHPTAAAALFQAQTIINAIKPRSLSQQETLTLNAQLSPGATFVAPTLTTANGLAPTLYNALSSWATGLYTHTFYAAPAVQTYVMITSDSGVEADLLMGTGSGTNAASKFRIQKLDNYINVADDVTIAPWFHLNYSDTSIDTYATNTAHAPFLFNAGLVAAGLSNLSLTSQHFTGTDANGKMIAATDGSSLTNLTAANIASPPWQTGSATLSNVASQTSTPLNLGGGTNIALVNTGVTNAAGAALLSSTNGSAANGGGLTNLPASQLQGIAPAGAIIGSRLMTGGTSSANNVTHFVQPGGSQSGNITETNASVYFPGVILVTNIMVSVPTGTLYSTTNAITSIRTNGVTAFQVTNNLTIATTNNTTFSFQATNIWIDIEQQLSSTPNSTTFVNWSFNY